FWGEVDPVSGRVIGKGHPLEGQSLAGHVLVMRSTRGSSATPMVLNLARLEGVAPAAFINVEVDSLAALGAIVNGIPMVTDLERNPFEAIRTGDYLIVDATAGLVEVRRGSAQASGGG
ncbi:MAG: aconitase X swivel domain-containing protein, partial [Bryobacteraceae bacterium]